MQTQPQTSNPTPEDISQAQAMAAETGTPEGSDQQSEPTAGIGSIAAHLVGRMIGKYGKEIGPQLPTPKTTKEAVNIGGSKVHAPRAEGAETAQTAYTRRLELEGLVKPKAEREALAKTAEMQGKPMQVTIPDIQDGDIALLQRKFESEYKNNRVPEVESARGDSMTDEKIRELADIFMSDPDELKNLLRRDPNSPVDATQVYAIRSTVELLNNDIVALTKQFEAGEIPDMGEVRKRLAMMNKAYGTYRGVSKTSGDNLRANKVDRTVDPEQLGAMDQVAVAAHMEELGITDESLSLMVRMTEGEKELGAVADAVKAAQDIATGKEPGKVRKFFNGVHEIFINGILSNPKTHMVNFTGSQMRMGVDVLDTFTASLIPTADVNNLGKVARGEASRKLIGMHYAWWDSLTAASKVFKSGERYGDNEFAEMATNKAIPDWLGGAAWRFPTERVMGATDTFNKVMSERASLYGEAYSIVEASALKNKADKKAMLLDLLENPSDEMLENARLHGKTMTFQEDLGEAGKKFQQVLKDIPGVRGVVPFYKTPTNLLKQGFLERTPLGLKSEKYRADIAAGGRKAQMARAKMINGSLFTASIVGLTTTGMLTGHYSKDPAIRKMQMDAGMKEMSLNYIGEDGTPKAVSLDRLEPFSYIIGMVADLAAAHEEAFRPGSDDSLDAKFETLMSGVVVAISDNTLNKSYMTGVRDIMDAAMKGGAYADNYFKKFIAGRLPYSGALMAIANQKDPTVRMPEGFKEYMESRLPGLNEGLPPRVDYLGRPVERTQLIFHQEPVTLKTTWLDERILNLAEEVGKVPVTGAPKRIDGGELTKLDAYMFMQYKTEDGEYERKLGELIETFEGSSIPLDTQLKLVREIDTEYNNMAKKKILESSPTLNDRIMYLKEYQANEALKNF